MPKVPSQVPPRPAAKLPGLALIGPAVMLKIHPTLSAASLADSLATDEEPDNAGKHPLQNHVPHLPRSAAINLEVQTNAAVNLTLEHEGFYLTKQRSEIQSSGTRPEIEPAGEAARARRRAGGPQSPD